MCDPIWLKLLLNVIYIYKEAHLQSQWLWLYVKSRGILPTRRRAMCPLGPGQRAFMCQALFMSAAAEAACVARAPQPLTMPPSHPRA